MNAKRKEVPPVRPDPATLTREQRDALVNASIDRVISSSRPMLIRLAQK